MLSQVVSSHLRAPDMQIFECIGILQTDIKKLSAEVTRLASLQKDHLQEDNRRAARETQVEIDLQSTYACDGMKHGYLEIIKIILMLFLIRKHVDLFLMKATHLIYLIFQPLLQNSGLLIMRIISTLYLRRRYASLSLSLAVLRVLQTLHFLLQFLALKRMTISSKL